MTFFACGTLLSKSHTGITGYHCEYQSNFSPWLSLASNSSRCESMDSANGDEDKVVDTLKFSDLFV
uniref:Protochlorophyllide-dependent translocon component 52ic-like isoform X1 n=1 Tax=Rhizophora mucronata TaxID=61149 RepID=A0A2P2KPE4_RHIMU